MTMSRAEERALEEYPPQFDAYCEYNATLRVGYKIGYAQAEKDMTAEARERVVKVDAGGYPYIDSTLSCMTMILILPLLMQAIRSR